MIVLVPKNYTSALGHTGRTVKLERTMCIKGSTQQCREAKTLECVMWWQTSEDVPYRTAHASEAGYGNGL